MSTVIRIAVLSDTHLRVPTPFLESLYEQHLAPAHAVLHLGDVTGEATLAYLMNHPRFYGVAGNMDGFGVSDHLPATRSVEFGGLTIAMAHGWGYGRDPAPGLARHLGPEADLVCFGHTHMFQWGEVGGVHMLNPGSASAPRRGAPSMALLAIGPDRELDAEMIDLSDLF